MKTPTYLGVDIGGMNNTWMAGLSMNDGSLKVVHGPRRMTLAHIAEHCEERHVVAVAIDAQLTAALSEENGFRTSDEELRKMLCNRGGSRNWVASANGLMAVPVRGRLLAERLSPTVGTIIETHPRASLLFGLGKEYFSEIHRRDENDIQQLWKCWSERFSIICGDTVENDGALDAIVCATVAWSFHHEPENLHKLQHAAKHKIGRGPFYVVSSNANL